MKTLIFISILVFAFAFSVMGQSSCPTISVIGPSGITRIGESMTFTAKVEGIELEKIRFEWFVSADNFSGQGKSSIIIAINADMAGQIITATVEVSGLPENCPKAASSSGEIVPPVPIGSPRIIEEYGRISWTWEKLKLDGVAAEINNYPELMAVFIFSKPSNENLNIFKIRLTKIGKYLTEARNISKDRVRFRVINDSDYATRIWVPPMLDFGEPTTWEQDIERLFPKKLSVKKSKPKKT